MQADWIYCCDVLEHIPESQIDLVLQGMAERMGKGGYLSICLKEDLFGTASMGEPLHLTVKDKSWWKQKLSTYWQIQQEAVAFEGICLRCVTRSLEVKVHVRKQRRNRRSL